MEFDPNQLDDIFRQRLHDAEAPPPAFVWPNVARELQKRKRRRFFLWLFAFGIAGAGLWAMFAPQMVHSPVAGNTTQAVSKDKKETAPATLPVPSEYPKQGSAEADAEGTSLGEANGTARKPAIEKRSAKGSDLQPVPPVESQVDILNGSDILTDVSVSSQNEQVIPVQSDLTGLLPLETTAPEPLVFSRKNDFPRVKISIHKKKDPKYCYNFTEHPNAWMIDAYAGPSFNKRTLEATDPSFESYAQMRRATEQTDWSFNAGLRGSLLLDRHFLIRTGLHYEQLTEVFEYADPSYVKYIVEIINQPGEPTIIDTVDVEYGENYVKTYNRFGMLDVPVELGAELRSGRFGLSLNAGLSFNILFWKRGTILSPNNQPTPFTPGEKGATDVFRTRTGLSATGSAQLFFHMNPTVRVFTEPYYRKTLKPVTLEGQQVEQRHSNWGVKIGMTKILD